MFIRQIIIPVFLSIIIFIFIGCDENSPADSPLTSESETLVKYLEANGDYINTLAPTLISAEEVRNGMLTKKKQIIFDLRTGCFYYSQGHIEGAIQIEMKDIPWYYRNNSLENMERVIITCPTGQEASYAAALLRYYGYNNVYSMTFGMTSWNSTCDTWSEFISDSKASLFETKEYAKNSAGNLPELSTGKTISEEILLARVLKLMEAGFDSAQISSDEVFLNLSKYYIIDACAYEQYLAGHVPNSVNYIPHEDFKLGTYLKTIPTDKTVAVYCATGQTSAQFVAFLRILGYDARSILYGDNGMNYSRMQGKKFSPSEIKNYPVLF
jgi:rhodanese-related sulfurtransferase